MPSSWVFVGLQDNKDTGNGAGKDCKNCPMCRIKVRSLSCRISWLAPNTRLLFFHGPLSHLALLRHLAQPGSKRHPQCAWVSLVVVMAAALPQAHARPAPMGCSLEELRSRAAEAARLEQQLRDEVSRAAAEARKRNDEVRRKQQEEDKRRRAEDARKRKAEAKAEEERQRAATERLFQEKMRREAEERRRQEQRRAEEQRRQEDEARRVRESQQRAQQASQDAEAKAQLLEAELEGQFMTMVRGELPCRPDLPAT